MKASCASCVKNVCESRATKEKKKSAPFSNFTSWAGRGRSDGNNIIRTPRGKLLRYRRAGAYECIRELLSPGTCTGRTPHTGALGARCVGRRLGVRAPDGGPRAGRRRARRRLRWPAVRAPCGQRRRCRGVVIGEGTVLGVHTSAEHCRIGADCILHSGVRIRRFWLCHRGRRHRSQEAAACRR